MWSAASFSEPDRGTAVRYGPSLIRSPLLHDLPGVRHLFLGKAFPRPPEEEAWKEEVMARAAALGAARETAVLRQVHGRRVALFRAGGEAFPARSLEGDGAATDRAGLVLAIRVADCLPVFLADREGRAAALLHAGWRGLAAGIVEEGLAALARLGAAPERLVAWIGPSVGPCCYEVGGEVIRAFRGAARTINGGEEKPRLDLYETARAILLRAGVDPERIDRRPPCTACAPHRFHSHRAHPEKGGRNLALLFLDR